VVKGLSAKKAVPARRKPRASPGEESSAGSGPGCCFLDVFSEAYRLKLTRGLEDLLARGGWAAIAGVDEAGRGALAGPVVAAAVVVDPGCSIPGVDDSKMLSASERERLAEVIRARSLAFAVARVGPELIDRINILEATRRAMLEALGALTQVPDGVVVDAVRLPGLPYPCLPVVRGDAVSYAVACASILAKVERDRAMVDLDRLYPYYGFASHKGYGAPEHLRALAAYGPSPVHRLTFRRVVPRLEVPATGRRRPRGGQDEIAVPFLPLGAQGEWDTGFEEL
jgi:ribonuclease HII